MNNDPFRIPTDAEIATAEGRLGIRFHDDYLKKGDRFIFRLTF